jgi:SWI/SNF-related matrix-associated actin-dependent regulator 1 of chromatin subfamily A
MEPGLELFLFQKKGIRFASEREGVLIADEMGLGKSAQANGVINEDPAIRKVIIVCPASMRIPWRREVERWLDRPLSVGVVEVDNGSPHDLFSKNVVIINYDRVTRFTRELSVSVNKYAQQCTSRILNLLAVTSLLVF